MGSGVPGLGTASGPRVWLGCRRRAPAWRTHGRDTLVFVTFVVVLAARGVAVVYVEPTVVETSTVWVENTLHAAHHQPARDLPCCMRSLFSPHLCFLSTTPYA